MKEVGVVSGVPHEVGRAALSSSTTLNVCQEAGLSKTRTQLRDVSTTEFPTHRSGWSVSLLLVSLSSGARELTGRSRLLRYRVVRWGNQDTSPR